MVVIAEIDDIVTSIGIGHIVVVMIMVGIVVIPVMDDIVAFVMTT